MNVEDLAGSDHWDAREGRVRPRLPSKLNAGVADLLALLDKFVRPDSRVLEVGCAPGKFLLWCALAKNAEVCGVEYASKSHQGVVDLFADASALADIRNEDFMETTFEEKSFDVVFSFGVIEHFSDPRPMVQKHVSLLRPGGTALITVPNFGGVYGRLLRQLDKPVYDIHNVSIMSEPRMLELVAEGIPARSYAYGRLSPWILSAKSVPHSIVKAASYGLNVLALFQPFEIKALCPWLVLEIKAPK
jgi:SAM-dependent methyltransferase